MRVLVTGATGFVGGAIVSRLLDEGHEVHLYARDPEAHGLRPHTERGAVVHAGPLGDPNALARAARGAQAIVHAAGESSHRASRRALGWINVAGTENVVNAAQHAGVRRLVHLSCTDATLIAGPRVNWSEDRVLMGAPYGPHARSKAESEELVLGRGGRGASGHRPFETVVLRPAQVWGAGDRSELPRLCREGLRSGLSLFGKGENLVAVVHVANVAEAALSALVSPDAPGGVFHLIDRELVLAREFFGAVSEAVGLPAPRRGLGLPLERTRAALRRRLGLPGPWPVDVLRRAQSTSFDIQRAREALDYQPVMEHAEGLRALAAWAERQGGAETLARAGRPAAQDVDVAAQIEASRR